MATFKVGDRVRIVCEAAGSCNGKEGTIWKIHRAPCGKWGDNAKASGARWWHSAYLVDVDGEGRHCGGFGFGFLGYPHFYLRPALRDPDAAEFVERMKKLGREPMPAVERETILTKRA